MSARTIAHVLFRRRRLIATVTLAALALGAALVQVRPPAYRAEAVLMADTARADGASALAALFTGGDLHAAVLAGLGTRLYPALSPAERATAFAAALAVKAGDGSSLVRVTFDGARPALAAEALTALMDEVARRNRTVFRAQADQGAAGGDAGIDVAAERSALRERRAALERDRAAAEAEAAAQSGTLEMLKARLAATPKTIELSAQSGRSRVVDEARAKLFELETKEQELLGKYQPESTFVARVRDERRKVETLLRELMATSDTHVTQGTNEVHQALEKDLFRVEAAATSARGRAKALAAQLEAVDARLASLVGQGGRAAAVDGIGVVSRGAPRPVGPGLGVILGLSGLAGLMLSLALAAVAERLSTRFSTPADVERHLGLPVLTSIPRES